MVAVDEATEAQRWWWSRAASAIGGYKVLALWLLPLVVVICGACVFTLWYMSRLGLEGTAGRMLVLVLAMSQAYAFVGSLGWIIKFARWYRRVVKKAEPAADRALDWWMAYLQEKFDDKTAQQDTE